MSAEKKANVLREAREEAFGSLLCPRDEAKRREMARYYEVSYFNQAKHALRAGDLAWLHDTEASGRMVDMSSVVVEIVSAVVDVLRHGLRKRASWRLSAFDDVELLTGTLNPLDIVDFVLDTYMGADYSVSWPDSLVEKANKVLVNCYPKAITARKGLWHLLLNKNIDCAIAVALVKDGLSLSTVAQRWVCEEAAVLISAASVRVVFEAVHDGNLRASSASELSIIVDCVQERALGLLLADAGLARLLR